MATLDDAKPLIDFNGNVAYLTPTTLEVYDEAGLDLGITGVYASGYTDLGEPSADKLLNYIDVDYVGECLLTFEAKGVDDEYIEFAPIHLPSRAYRGTVWIQLPLVERRAFQKLRYILDTHWQNTIIYGLEIDFSVLRRRREN